VEARTLISNTHDIETLQQQSDELTQQIKENNNQIKEIDIRLEKSNIGIKKLEEQKDSILSSQHSDIDEDVVKLDYNSIIEEIGRLSGLIVNKEEEKNHIVVKEPTDYIDTLELENHRNLVNDKKLESGILENEISKKKDDIIVLQNSEVCPVCKRGLDDVDHTKEIDNLKKEATNKKNKLKEVNKILSSMIKQLTKLENLKLELDLYDKNKLIKEKKVLEIESLENARKDKKNLTMKYESNQKKIEHNKKVESEKLKIQSKLDITKVNKNNYLDEKNTILIRQEQSKRTLNENIDKIETIKKEEEIQRIFKTYLTAFGKNGIPKVILKSLMPVINNEPLTAGSGYEKTISSLALRAILSKFSSLPKPNVTVFDEVFGKISNENLHIVKEFFLKLKEYFDCVFLITHNPLVTEWGDNVITIKKTNNVSKI
jgi:DNA repair exonuclease SbcCD ATPase subunit